ncbi:hypothetical protein [Methyloferula stellata]|uniref:hypothetical protein n=1 Tax=Methyloferula stellata TaxID=876270 RepID=UPI0003682C30|nr:hypothetical protein [Methyloferula stellata]
MTRILELHSFIQNSAVRMGRLIIPARLIEATLHRYVKALVCQTGSAEFPYSLRGAMAMLKFGGRYFAIFCRHQIADLSPGDVSWLPQTAGGAVYIGGGTFCDISPDTSNEDEEFTDVCGIEFQPNRYTIENLDSEFFEIVPDDCWPSNSLGYFIVFGMPSCLQRVEISEIDSKMAGINFRTLVVGARYLRKSHARWVHQAEMLRKDTFEADGMSGGAVFHIGRDTCGYFVGLAGIVMRGSASSANFHFIDMGFLHQFWETESLAINR